VPLQLQDVADGPAFQTERDFPDTSAWLSLVRFVSSTGCYGLVRLDVPSGQVAENLGAYGSCRQISLDRRLVSGGGE